VIDRGLTVDEWDKVIHCAQLFSANCCKSISNSIDKEFGEEMKGGLGQPRKL
jgi:fructokinase